MLGRTSDLVQIGNAAYKIVGRPLPLRFERMTEAPSGESLLDVTDASGGRGTVRRLVLLTDKSVRVVSNDGRPRFHAERRVRVGHSRSLRVAALEDGRYVLWWRPYEGPEIVQLLSSDGTVEAEHPLPWLGRSRDVFWWESLLGLVLPIGAATVMTVVSAATRGWEQTLAYEPFHPNLWPLMFTMAIISTLATYAIARRYAFTKGRRIFWCVLTFLLGPLGVVALPCIAERPTRETCASCGRPRFVDHETCEHCSTGWPAPPLDGTEIFDATPEAAGKGT